MSGTRLNMYRGDTQSFAFAVTRSGAVEDLAGSVLWFTVKTDQSVADDDALFQKSTTNGGIVVTDEPGGLATVTVDPEDTEDLAETATYQFDLQLKTSGGNIETVATGQITITADYTRSTT